MFCVKCGEKADAGMFCRKCFLGKERLFELKDIKLTICDSCHVIEHNKSLKDAIMKNIKTKNKISDCSIFERSLGNRIYITVKCTGHIKPVKSVVEGEEKAIVFFRKRKCENCIRLAGGYYEAVFQVRGENQGKIMKKLEHLIPGEMLTGVHKLKEGYDVKIVDKKIAGRIVSILRNKHEVKESFKLVGTKKGKDLYRNFYAIR